MKKSDNKIESLPMNKDIVFWILFAIVVGLAVYLLFFIKSNSFQCISNPAKYTFTEIKKSGLEDVNCFCSSNGCSCTATHSGVPTPFVLNFTT